MSYLPVALTGVRPGRKRKAATKYIPSLGYKITVQGRVLSYLQDRYGDNANLTWVDIFNQFLDDYIQGVDQGNIKKPKGRWVRGGPGEFDTLVED